jgi:hypothetical protein
VKREGKDRVRSQKKSHRIVVETIEYHWRAPGNDGYISIGIWPANNIGPFITGSIRYHETWIDNGNGSFSSAGDQIVITNRIIKRVIEHAVMLHQYDPHMQGNELNLKVLDDVIKWADAVRASQDKKIDTKGDHSG